MSAEELRGNVETIEAEAEKMIKEARQKANEILRKANEEANKLLAARESLDEVKKECEVIIGKAKGEAQKEIDESKSRSARIKTATNKKADDIARHIVSLVTGAETK